MIIFSSMIEEKLEYKFQNCELLETALTHSSFANETSCESNERLEFLGDAILGCVTARVLYEKFPDATEGELSKLRGSIVSKTNFVRYAQELKIDKQILLGKGEESTGGRERESNLCGTFEAIIGAIYLDGGYKKSYQIISKLVNCTLKNNDIYVDDKTRLQEITQKEFKEIPRYEIVKEEGPPHNKTFYVEVSIKSGLLGKGKGKNKKKAEQSAARKAIKKLEKN